MLTDELFVLQTLANDLYYLRTIREFCANIQLAFLDNNQEYKDIAEQFALKCEELGGILIKYADGRLPKSVLDSGILVTKYTLPCEKLTEKLFDIKIATEITEKELALTPGRDYNPSQDVIDELMRVNREANVMIKNFIEFCQDIYDNQKKQNLFSYSYLAMYRYMLEEAKLFETTLERLINKDNIDPTYVIDYEYWFNISMKDAAMFIRGLVDPDSNDIFVRANSFVSEFDVLISEYKTASLSPDTQEQLTSKSLRAVERFRMFIADVIQDVLNADLYFIIEPIFLDNMYTAANYFRYILTLNRKDETDFS